ncbi:hypothetical protein BUALT_Bualt07G0019300 [Buddleja alternifolia]|uniref:Uncharacterized protein n=1 Tax=Buddleja alternifolia TaxID=168488 RepID=A0AAV6XFF0_9LAMI|nr:hypothetical protein BUALT_Bualt07G0019300 [Buddleja alternifolia]
MMKAEAMDRRFTRHLPNEGRPAITLQRKLAETKRVTQNTNQIPDLTDFMNDMFFGTMDGADQKKAYNLTSGDRGHVIGNHNDDDSFDSSTRSVSSRQTQEWLEEAKRMVASSPSRGSDSPARLVGSPRFAISQGRFSTSSLDKRDPFTRSARRHRATEGLSGEILSKTAIHTRNRSVSNSDLPQPDPSPRSDIQKWISNNLKIPNSPPNPTISPDPTPPSPTNHLGAPPLPPRQSMHRRSRFQTGPNSPSSHPIPTPTNLPAISLSKRNFKTTTSTNNNAPNAILETQLLSPPKHLIESAHRRSVSSNTCTSLEAAAALSSPQNLVESAHRRSISSSTCRSDKSVEKENADDRVLKNGGTSSMVAATCYAWLLENRMKANKKGGPGNGDILEFVVPVMNIRRGKLWKQRQAAWLFHHVGLDATSLLFSNEVELETLMMAKQLSMLIVGEDILKTNGEVGSACTVLTDNYCEDAYDLLQTPILKKLLLAGILLDTQNLSTLSPKLSMTRDAEAVQLLSVASAPYYRNTLYDQLMQDQRDNNFFEVLRRTYGKPPSEINWDNGAPTERKISEKNYSNEVIASSDDKKRNDTNDVRTKKVSPNSGKPTPSPAKAPMQTTPAKPAPDASRGKNKNFFAKLFGFGTK